MKKSKKFFIILAIVLISLGLIACVYAFCAVDFDVESLYINEHITESKTIDENFDAINLTADSIDVNFVASENDTCKIEYTDIKQAKYDISVNDGVLNIKRVDNRKWYEYIDILDFNNSLIVAVPKEKIKSLCIYLQSGNVSAENISVFGDMDIKTQSGNISLKNVDTKGKMNIETSSGNIKFDLCSAFGVSANTHSGDVSGKFTNDMKYVAKTHSGDIRVPETNSNLVCEVSTHSGNIIFE